MEAPFEYEHEYEYDFEAMEAHSRAAPGMPLSS
jgi:hypothetical protein